MPHNGSWPRQILSLALRCDSVGWQASDANSGRSSLPWEKPDCREPRGRVFKLRTLYQDPLSLSKPDCFWTDTISLSPW